MKIRINAAAIIVLTGIFSTAHAVDAYVDQFISYKNASQNDANLLGFQNGTPGTLINVSGALATGAPTYGEWVAVQSGYEAIYSFTGQKATTGLNIYSVANGANESAEIYGRLNSTDSWSFLGMAYEPLTSSGYSAQSSFINLSGFSNGIAQVKVRSLSDGGWSPGYDLMGIQGQGMVAAPVPEPETYALMGLGLTALLVNRRRKINVE